MAKESCTIGNYQAVALCFISLVTFSVSGQLLGHNIWLAFVISLGFGALVFLLYRSLFSLYPGQDLPSIYESAFGKWSKPFLCLFLVQFVYVFAHVLLLLIFFWTYLTMPIMPVYVYAIIIIAFTVLGAAFGLEAIARISVLMVAVLFLVVLIDTLMVVPNMDFERFLPIGGVDFGLLLKFSWQFFLLQFGMLPLVLMFITKIKQSKKAPKVLGLSLLLVSIFYMVTIVRAVAVLGDSLLVQDYATAQILRMTEWNSILSHLELMGLMIIVIISVLFLILNQYISGRLLCRISGRSDYRWFLLPLAAVETFLVVLMYCLSNTPDNKILYFLGTLFIVVNMISLLLVMLRGVFLKKRRKKEEKQINW